MENNFELEEMKQQWSTLQTALNSQKEINIKLVLKDAKKRVSWNRGFLRSLFFITLFLTIPAILLLLPYYDVPQPISVALVVLIIALALATLYLSFIIQTPNDGNIDILRYSKSLVRFKKVYWWSEISGWLGFISWIIWAVTSMGLDITSPKAIIIIIAGVIGTIIGVSLDIKMLNNIKELQSDIDLIDGLQE